MSSITIRKLDPAIKERLRLRAAEHGHSMEAEARDILQGALGAKLSDVPPKRTGADPIARIARDLNLWVVSSWNCLRAINRANRRHSTDVRTRY